MKASTLCIPLFFALLFLDFLLCYAFLDPGFKGFSVEIGRVALRDQRRDVENFVVQVLSGVRLKLNGELVDQQQLRQRLQKTFQHRPEQVVYVLGHRDVTLQEVVTAMDMANGAAKNVHVRLVTPGNQNEMRLGRDPLDSLRHADK